MNPARVVRWSLIVAPMLAGVALLIFGTAGGISTGFGVVLIGIGPIVWMWNWFIRMAFSEEAQKQEARERGQGEGEQRGREPERQEPGPLEPGGQQDLDPRQHHPLPASPDPHHRSRTLGRAPRRRPH